MLKHFIVIMLIRLLTNNITSAIRSSANGISQIISNHLIWVNGGCFGDLSISKQPRQRNNTGTLRLQQICSTLFRDLVQG